MWRSVARPALCRGCRSISTGPPSRTYQEWYRQMQGQFHSLLATATPGNSSTPLTQESLRTFLRQSTESSQTQFLPVWLTRSLCDLYEELPEQQQKHALLAVIATEAGISPAKVKTELTQLHDQLVAVGDQQQTQVLSDKLTTIRASLQPLYVSWFHQLVALPKGLKFLINMRAELMQLVRTVDAEYKFEVKQMMDHLTEVLRECFAVSWLALRNVEWNTTTPAIIEKMMKHEKVHPTSSWMEMKSRIQPTQDRYCFAFFHPALPHDALSFIYVAITEEISSSLPALMARDVQKEDKGHLRLDSDKCAIFYGITNAHHGLGGIDLGHQLIQQAVGELSQTVPNLKHFSTLSPMPTFRSWLTNFLQHTQLADTEIFSVDCVQTFKDCGMQKDPANQHEMKQFLHRKLCSDFPGCVTAEWSSSVDVGASLIQKMIEQLAVRFLVVEKRRGRACCGVANFHLKNGATLWRLNWMGNPSERGLTQSCGLMVNYLYDLEKVKEQSKLYERDGTISTSGPFREMQGL